jgi:hypothetical protein
MIFILGSSFLEGIIVQKKGEEILDGGDGSIKIGETQS